jgi:predicted DNA-binding transcriptional regulator YafY
MDTILRYLEMLRLIPVEPANISTPDLLIRLQNLGYEVDIRTLQRDLIKLSSSRLFPFTSSENTKPLCWFWPKQAVRVQFPVMTAEEALTFKLVEQFLQPLLPQSVNGQLEAYYQLAANTLAASPLGHWADKVRIVGTNQNLLPAQVKPEVLAVVYEALLKNRRFSATYRPRGKNKDENVSYEVNPLGLIFKGSAVYLLATLWDYADYKQLALHRLQEATLLDKAVVIPKGFKLDNYIADQGFDYPVTPERAVNLILKIQPWLYRQLLETPLSKNQKLTPIDDNSYQLQATVKDTNQLRWWLKSLGVDVEVLEPLSLREEFATLANTLSRMYQ